jgi:predicted phage terminase large subunit-like protein
LSAQAVRELTLADVEREIGLRGSFYDFVEMAAPVIFPEEFVPGWHIAVIGEALEAVLSGELKKLVVNIPPGCMKPVWEGEMVVTSRGPVPLRDVRVGDLVLTHRGRFRKVTAVHEQGQLPTVVIRTNNGRAVRAAPDHPFLTPRGWVNAGDLTINDYVGVPHRVESWGDGSCLVSDDFARCDRDAVVSVKDAGPARCRCLTVEEDQSFTAGGLAVHNSRLVSVLYPVWCWIRRPKMSFMATSFDGDLTYRDAKYSLELITSRWFLERWGDIVSVSTWAAVGDHKNSRGGWRFATSVGSKATGRHPDVKIIDDPTKPATITPASLAETEAYYNNTLRSRGVRGATILIMQRLAINDLAGVMDREGDAHMLVLPMRYKPETAYPKDPRRTRGELLWPALYGEREVMELEKMPLRDRAAQLDQQPVPEGGAIIKREWIRWYDPGAEPRRFSERAQTWDCAFKDTKGSSKVAGQVWGIQGPDFWFLDGVLDHLDFTKTVEQMGRYVARFPGAALLIEDKANGSAAINIMKRTVTGIVPIEPEGGKSARLNAVSVIFEAGNVYLPKGNPVAEQLAAHLIAFPAGDCDDDVDACSQLLNHFFKRVVDYAAAMRGLRPGAF